VKLSTGAISDGVTTVVPTATNAADIEALLPEGWRHIALCDRATGAVMACWQYAPRRIPAGRTTARPAITTSSLPPITMGGTVAALSTATGRRACLEWKH